jgi:hypothetical protein
MKAERKYKIIASQKTSEPTWTTKTATKSELSAALNWYNANIKDPSKFLSVSNPKLAAGFETLAFARRMASRGCILPTKEAETIRKMEEEFKARVDKYNKQVQATTSTKKVVNIQELVANKADEYIAELEGCVDYFGITGDVKNFNAYTYMQELGVKAAHVPFIVAYFKKQAEEPMRAAEGKDKDLVEAYSSFSKARLMNLLSCYAKIITDANKLNQNIKVARKPRKKKPVSSEKKVSKLNYMEQDAKLKLRSIDPVKIVGATQLWVYNTKTKKLGVYMSNRPEGLDVKNSTIIGYGEAGSISKTLRKPEKVLPEVVSGGKITLRKMMDGINSKPSPLNGRISQDVILLRVVKI